MRRQKSLRIGVHHVDGVVWGPVYRTRLMRDRRRPRRTVFPRRKQPPGCLDVPADATRVVPDGVVRQQRREELQETGRELLRPREPVSYTHLTLPTIYSV